MSITRDKIISAAIDVFASKGKFGAAMEEIAREARVNKAMVYYFFGTKENLYRAVLSEILYRIFEYKARDMEKLVRLKDKLKSLDMIVKRQMKAYSLNGSFAKILIDSITSDPSDIEKAIENIRSGGYKDGGKIISPEKMIEYFQDGISRKIFRSVNIRQLLISMVGMSLVYSIAKPIAQILLEIDVKNEKRFLKERQESITDILLHGIMRGTGR